MTDREIGLILANIKVICDNREKNNKHILDYLERNEIPYEVRKVDTGDYTFELPDYQHLNLDHSILIERKNSLDEIAGNFSGNRERFQREYERVKPNQTIHTMIEGATFKKLLKGSYRSKLAPSSLLASLLTWNVRYGTPIWFATEDDSPHILYNIIKYGLREKLKNL